MIDDEKFGEELVEISNTLDAYFDEKEFSPVETMLLLQTYMDLKKAKIGFDANLSHRVNDGFEEGELK